jgi:hypothetical protein
VDPQRFDNLARSFSSRVSRRTAFRAGGAGLAATIMASFGWRAAGARQAGSAWYTVIRSYKLSGSTDEVTQELDKGYLPLIQQAEGFVQYSVIVTGSDTITTITMFETQAQLESAAQSEAEWVQQNLASLLPAPAEQFKGSAVVAALNTDLICGPGPTEEPTVAPTATPTEAPCTAIGCACNGGVQGACDEGLVCCQSQMGGGSIPGGAGMCAAEDACGDDATPVT